VRRRWARWPLRGLGLHLVAEVRDGPWRVQADCLGILPERWVWEVTGWHQSARTIEEVTAALAHGLPHPRPTGARLVEHVAPPPARHEPPSHVHVRIRGHSQSGPPHRPAG